MNEKFSARYQHLADSLGVRKSKALEVRRTPDAVDVVSVLDLELKVYSKLMRDVIPPAYVVVVEKTKPDQEILFAAPIPTNYSDDVATRTPTRLLELLIDRAGVDLTVAGEKRRFVLQQDIVDDGRSEKQLILEATIPRDHFFLTFSWTIDPAHPQALRCAMMFCLDTSKAPRMHVPPSQPPAADADALEVMFAPDVSPQQMEAALHALAEIFRASGGKSGLQVDGSETRTPVLEHTAS